MRNDDSLTPYFSYGCWYFFIWFFVVGCSIESTHSDRCCRMCQYLFYFFTETAYLFKNERKMRTCFSASSCASSPQYPLYSSSCKNPCPPMYLERTYFASSIMVCSDRFSGLILSSTQITFTR